MRKVVTAFVLALLFYIPASAQLATFKGIVRDTSEKKNLQNAVISILGKKDSVLTHFTRTNKNGEFEITSVKEGAYVLLVTYPKFADYVDEIQIKNNEVKNIGNIALTNKSELLKEVVIRGGAAIRIKGDTTEFNADSFVVREGATVEELLKKLPGFQVNSKGEITAQGKRVEKVLVDGEEFFGDDPTMATQNLSAKAVDKVQLFETKSDQQQMTGITTGNEGKTLNIKLKEDKKKGAFGKVNAGTDFTKYYDAKALYNKFIGKRKLSAYASRTNITTGSLNWEDRQKLGIEEDMEYDEISGYYMITGGNDEFNDWSFRGLPNAYTAGALFIDKWNGDKQSLNTSYRFNRLGTENTTSRYVQSILNNTINYRNTFSTNNGYNQQHALNGKYEWKVDSLTTFKFSTAGVHKISETFTNTNTEYLNNAKEYINTSDQQRESSTKRMQSDNVLTYKQLFKKKNRQLLATLRFGITNDDNSGNIKTRAEFYKRGVVDSVDVLDQLKNFNGESITLGSKVTFSEPINDKWNVVLDYALNKNNSTSKRNTFNKDNNGKYEVLDSA
ncbi:MAG TPA: carboxypeptidase regulatory-like domain-containing protein, partial [Chitinophagaceae bacterium]|nr:carboxypeptidase regulatory-like domain-containing protein [Chitinophagaceae bacterium]